MAVAAHSTLAPASTRPAPRARRSGVQVWLWSLAALVVLMVAIGGATRLTGSGLSITEWKPVTGAVPPLSDTAWSTEFEKYRASSQYRNLNRGMALSEFKTIYWWEWGHRQLGRLLGLAFALPLAWFWWMGAIGRRLALGLLGIGALGGLQATVGWIMVASGLAPGMVAVAPLKLMLHLVLASLILALLVWAADAASPSPLAGEGVGPEGRRMRGHGAGDPSSDPASQGHLLPQGEKVAVGWAALFVGVVFLQIALGGLVAGAKAGWTYNTWPLMDGRLIPTAEALGALGSIRDNLVANPALVQVNHRLTAYLVVAVALWQAWRLRGAAPSPASRRAVGLAVLALAQMALGIVTLLLAVPLWAGLAHQLLAIALLAAATIHLRRCLATRDEASLSPAE